MEKAIILPLDAADPSITLCGGKGANLARLIRGGFTLPGGFLITTNAYHQYIKAHNLEDWIIETANSALPDDSTTLDRVSAAIRDRFAECAIPETLAREICDAYASMGRLPVAV